MTPAVNRGYSRQLSIAGCLMLTVIVFLATWRWRLANDVDSQLAAIHVAGLPTNGEEANAYYAAVPNLENAAVKMADAFALITNYNDRLAIIKFPQRRQALSSEDLDLISGYCAMNSNALAQAAEAIKMPHSRYPIDLAWGVDTLLPHLAGLKRLALAAEYRSVLDQRNSAPDISNVVGMARTLDEEPVLVSKLVRISMLNMATKALEYRLNAAASSDAELERLGKIFAESAKTNQIANGLVGERAMMIRYFRMSHAEAEKLSGSDDENSPQKGGPPLPGDQPYFFKFTGLFERDLRFYLESMETTISLASTFPKNMLAISNSQQQISETSRRNYYFLSSMFLPALGNANVKEANSVAQMRAAQTALAVERFRLAHGQLPEKLDELVSQYLSAVPEDPFDGQPLRYRRLDRGYVVYSIGPDGEDNGGRERPADAKSTDKTHYDITFTVER